MHPTELHFIQLARQVSLVARQAAMAYEQAQTALNLDQLITPARIATAEGTRQSPQTLTALARLHADVSVERFKVALMPERFARARAAAALLDAVDKPR